MSNDTTNAKSPSKVKPGSKAGPNPDELVDLVLSKVTISDARIMRLFEPSKMTDEQLQQAERVRRAAAGFAQVIINETRNGPDRQAAIEHVRIASMLAVQSIAIA